MATFPVFRFLTAGMLKKMKEDNYNNLNYMNKVIK